MVRHRYFGVYTLGARAKRKGNFSQSGILFGPPGTGKTTIVEGIAETLGWPLISLDPYEFLRYGHDGVARAAREAFSWLFELEDCVILFDEMEEFMRSRTGRVVVPPELSQLSPEDGTVEIQRKFATARDSSIANVVPATVDQRLWTTLLLPLLQRLHDDARVLFFVATNHYDEVDPAIARPGRFDFRVQVLPPTPVRKINEVLMPVLVRDMRLNEEQAAGIFARLVEVLAQRRYWLVKEGTDYALRSAGVGEGNEPLSLRLTTIDGERFAGPIPLCECFPYYSLADARALGAVVAEEVNRQDPPPDELPDRVALAMAQAIEALAPVLFSFEAERNHLQWSRFRTTSGPSLEELEIRKFW